MTSHYQNVPDPQLKPRKSLLSVYFPDGGFFVVEFCFGDLSTISHFD